MIQGVLATIGLDGIPRTRVMDPAHIDDKGLVILTHSNTKKVQELFQNNASSMTVWLPHSKKAFTFRGLVDALPSGETQNYWIRLPRDMQLRFIASDHCSEIESNEPLREALTLLEEEWEGKSIPMPDVFLGYRILPVEIVFYEVCSGDFSKKYIAHLQDDGSFNMKQYHP